MNTPADYRLMLREMCAVPWAMAEDKLMEMVDIAAALAQGATPSPSLLARKAEIEAAARPSARAGGAIAVLPVFGLIDLRPSMLSRMYGAFSIEAFTLVFRAAANDPNVKAIVLNIDSPGGSAFGVEELADEIFAARAKKHIAAVANPFAASAAYWIGSAADEFVVVPSGQAGSIGTILVHAEFSKALEEAGIQVNVIRNPKAKGDVNMIEPLSDEARSHLQTMVDAYTAAFQKAVARNRGVSAAEVRSGFGQGRMANAKDAVSLGLVDRIATLDDVLQKLGAGQGAADGAAAASPTWPFDASGNVKPEFDPFDPGEKTDRPPEAGPEPIAAAPSAPAPKTEDSPGQTDEQKKEAARVRSANRRRRLALQSI